jgi:hypothetical protein
MVLGGGLVWASFSFHVLRTPDGVACVLKQQPTQEDIYVDVREWTPAEWLKHPNLVRDVVHDGRTDLLGRMSAEGHIRDLLQVYESED